MKEKILSAIAVAIFLAGCTIESSNTTNTETQGQSVTIENITVDNNASDSNKSQLLEEANITDSVTETVKDEGVIQNYDVIATYTDVPQIYYDTDAIVDKANLKENSVYKLAEFDNGLQVYGVLVEGSIEYYDTPLISNVVSVAVGLDKQKVYIKKADGSYSEYTQDWCIYNGGNYSVVNILSYDVDSDATDEILLISQTGGMFGQHNDTISVLELDGTNSFIFNGEIQENLIKNNVTIATDINKHSINITACNESFEYIIEDLTFEDNVETIHCDAYNVHCCVEDGQMYMYVGVTYGAMQCTVCYVRMQLDYVGNAYNVSNPVVVSEMITTKSISVDDVYTLLSNTNMDRLPKGKITEDEKTLFAQYLVQQECLYSVAFADTNSDGNAEMVVGINPYGLTDIVYCENGSIDVVHVETMSDKGITRFLMGTNGNMLVLNRYAYGNHTLDMGSQFWNIYTVDAESNKLANFIEYNRMGYDGYVEDFENADKYYGDAYLNGQQITEQQSNELLTYLKSVVENTTDKPIQEYLCADTETPLKTIDNITYETAVEIINSAYGIK